MTSDAYRELARELVPTHWTPAARQAREQREQLWHLRRLAALVVELDTDADDE